MGRNEIRTSRAVAHYRTPRIRELWTRVNLIEEMLPAHPLNAKGKPIPYRSERFRHVEELIAIYREVTAPVDAAQTFVAENIILRRKLKTLTNLHERIKKSNVQLRRQIK